MHSFAKELRLELGIDNFLRPLTKQSNLKAILTIDLQNIERPTLSVVTLKIEECCLWQIILSDENIANHMEEDAGISELNMNTVSSYFCDAIIDPVCLSEDDLFYPNNNNSSTLALSLAYIVGSRNISALLSIPLIQRNIVPDMFYLLDMALTYNCKDHITKESRISKKRLNTLTRPDIPVENESIANLTAISTQEKDESHDEPEESIVVNRKAKVRKIGGTAIFMSNKKR